MLENSNGVIRPKRLSFAVSVAMALLAADMAVAQDVKPATTTPVAQDAKKLPVAAPEAKKPAAPAAAAVAAEGPVSTIVVVGARESQRGSINRKKKAKTAMDSIVAEDVGAFPDRNVGEAISRIAGVALDRGDFGEGTSVSVRGNGADLTRVEMDGQAVQSGGGTDLLGGGDGRGVEFRELSSDLIKSVDVVKGSTADMVEGSLGGGIIIKTRTGLDFNKPFYSLRLGATQGSLNKKTTPNLNLVLSDKFLNNRLGVLVNLNKSEYANETHSLTNGGTNNQQGPLRLVDFDNSPEKTFTFSPRALLMTEPSVTRPFLSSPLTAGGTFDASSPLELITKSGAAQTKADCNATFPALSAVQTAAIGANARNAAITQRSSELITCLNQWNDYTPPLVRSYVKKQDDKRQGGDLRFDFKVNNELSVYAKGSTNKRTVEDTNSFLNFGNIAVNPPFVNSPSTGYAGLAFTDSASGVRTAVPNSGYYTFGTTVSARANSTPAIGAVANVKPGYVVDDSHHVTKYTITDGAYNTDMIFSKVDTSSDYLQLGGSYKKGDFFSEFFVGQAKSDSMRHDSRANFSYGYGEATFNVLPDGAWAFQLPENSNANQLNYEKYATYAPVLAQAASPVTAFNTVATPKYESAQRALYTPSRDLTVIRVRKSESEEKTARADLTYQVRERIPFITAFKGGFNLRESSSTSWGIGGAPVREQSGTFGKPDFVPGIYIPKLDAKSSFIGCKDTPGSLAPGGQPCSFGFNPGTNPAARLVGQTVLPEAAYLDLVKQTLSIPPSGQFYAGAKDRPDGLLEGFHTIDMDKLYALTGIQKNLDCVVRCLASDGNVYDQAISSYREKSYAGYFMTDFEIDRLPFSNKKLPFGIELTGNMGWRVVKTHVYGTGQLTFKAIKKVDGVYDDKDPTKLGGTTSTTYRTNTTINDDSTDVLPIFNLGAWLIPNKLVVRYNRAKTVARPGMSKLLPNINCTYDETASDLPNDADGTDVDQRCTGVMGNPGVKPHTNINTNVAIEWYPNKDTMFSAATFIQRGRIGAPNRVVPRAGVKVFSGSDAVDPVTGVRLSDIDFTFNQWDNLSPSTRRGVEFASKTAFTFLPSFLRYTGFDANFTRVRSQLSRPSYNLLSGEVLPPPGEPKYSYNASLWYDDGSFSARLALQVVAPRYSCYSPCTNSSVQVNNFPAENTPSWRLPYNPGMPLFQDRTRFLDAKMAYKFKNNMELFAEVRNLTSERTHSSSGGYEDYSGGIPNLFIDNYNGRRVMIGLNIRSAQ